MATLPMDWKQAIERWRAVPPEEKRRQRRKRIPLSVCESMVFEAESVAFATPEAEHAGREVMAALSNPVRRPEPHRAREAFGASQTWHQTADGRCNFRSLS